MYAFNPVECDPLSGCFIELSRAGLPGWRSAYRGNVHLRAYQSRLVFDIARRVLNAPTGYRIEKTLMGDAFATDAPTRWWERLGHRKLDLPRALARDDRTATMWMDRLARHTDAAHRALAMPIWSLSQTDRASVNAVMSWRQAVEQLGVSIPSPPTRSKRSVKQYVDALYHPVSSRETCWAGLNVAVFCLRLAQAKGDLSHYALTYETLISDEWKFAISSQAAELRNVWRNLRTFYDEWFSTLAVSVTDQTDWRELLDELEAHGLSYEVQDGTRA
ncbi:MAG: hypothetical protein KGJ38_11145, partial [Burkholderiaceae bacterium]|nr:hypothetical protein [Burkholderiaceae bacterium]